MRKAILVCLTLAVAAGTAYADARADCVRPGPDPDRAIRACNELIAIGDWAPWVYSARAQAQYFKRNLDLAVADHTKDIAAAYAGRGRVHTSRREFDLAIADLDKALEIDPLSGPIYFNRAVAYGRKGDFERAIADYTRAIDLDQPRAYYFSDRALAYVKAGKAALGLPDVERALAMRSQQPAGSNWAEVWDTRGHIVEALDRREEAITAFRAALQIDPVRQSSLDGLKRLGAE
jgi:tetratricopeptide (TPR) repeat protein